MSKISLELNGNFDVILNMITSKVMESASASLEDESMFYTKNCKCAVRVFERYSMIGGNRLSLNITLLQNDDRLFLSAISSGGSQAVFFKVNTFGEDAFLDCIRGVINEYTL